MEIAVTNIVLVVRGEPTDIPDLARREFEAKFGTDLSYQMVWPDTPEELDELTKQPGVVAVYLPDWRPLNALVVHHGTTPCVYLHDGDLAKMTDISIKHSYEPWD